MKKRWKKAAALLISAAMMAGLSACGGTNDSEKTPEGYTEVTFWHSMDRTYAEVLDEQIAAFNDTIGKEKKIKVTAVFQNYPGTDSLNAAMSSDDVDNMPDVIQLYTESVNLVRDYERTVWIEDLINAEESSIKKEDIVPNILNSFEINDKLIGMPYNIACYLLYYNEDQLKEAGFENPPETVSEMAEMLPVLTEKTEAQYGLNVRINMNELLCFVESQGEEGSYFGNGENGHGDYMTALQCEEEGTLKNFMEEWGKVIDTGAYKQTKDSINEEFAAGMHSMVIMSSSRLKTIEDLVGDSFSWNVAPVPVLTQEDSKGTFPTGSGLFILNRDDEKKVDAAWEFVQYMSSAEVQAQWVESTGYVPVNNKALESDIYKNAVKENEKLALPYEILSGSPENITAPFIPNYKEIDTLIKDTMISYANKEIDSQKAYDQIVEESKKIFETYYRANPVK